MDLFDNSCQQIQLPGADLYYYPNFLPAARAQQLFEMLRDRAAWQQDVMTIAGRQQAIPRLNAWYGDKGANYGYSGIILALNDWLPELLALRAEVEACAGHSLNSALLNLYRDGRDSVGWHADNEKELGPNPLIASISLGATRTFQLKANSGGKATSLSLSSGSLLLMSGETQHNWCHQVPKEPAVDQARINITFRHVLAG